MIAEVEIRNTVESIKLGSIYPPYTNDPEVPMLTGWLTEDGQLLHLDVNRELATDYTRIIYLYYSIVDTDYRKVDYYLIQVSDAITGAAEASSYEFDISSVVTIPKRTAKVLDINEITIDLFTYEANITDSSGTAIYGQKRLSVPYKTSADASVHFPNSTDGWYPIGVVDYVTKSMEYNNSDIFYEGDLVYWTEAAARPDVPTGVYKALATSDNTPLTVGAWILATEKEIGKFFTIPRPPSMTSAMTIVGANAIISRNVKMEYISGVLPRVSYKKNDDKQALYALAKLTSLRELSILKLEEGDLVSASYLLDVIRNTYDMLFITGKDVVLTQIEANYTI